MRRKVLIVSEWYPSEGNVSGIFVHDQAQILTQNFDVAVLVPHLASWHEIPSRGIRPISRLEKADDLIICWESSLIAVPRLPLLSHWSLSAGIAGVARRGLKKLEEVWGRPDLVHAHVVLPGGWAAVCLKKHLSVPAVLTEHSSPFAMHLRTGHQRWLVRKTLHGVDRVIAVSPWMEAQIRDFQPDTQPIVIGNVIKTELFTLPDRASETSPTKTLLLAIGGLVEQKGMRYLLEATKLLLVRGYTNFEIAIVGDGPLRSQLEQTAQEYGLAGRCHFLGLRAPIEVREWIHRCDLFILPSLHETFGIVVAEAMACGKPVIATRCGGPEFIVTPDIGTLIPPADSIALASAIEDFLCQRHSRHDPELVRQRIVDRFGENIFLSRMTELYEQLLK